MKCRTSFFNPTLYTHQLRRYWPLAAASLLGHLLLLLTELFRKMKLIGYHVGGTITRTTYGAILDQETISRELGSFFYGYGETILVLMLVLGFGAALLLTEHIHSRTAIQFYHGLPVKRLCGYVTGIVAGCTLVLAPAILVILLLMLLCLGSGVGMLPGLTLMYCAWASFTLTFSLGMLSCVLSGDRLGSLLIYIGLNCAALVIFCGAGYIGSYIIPGYDSGMIAQELAGRLSPAQRLATDLAPRWNDTGNAVGLASPLSALLDGVLGLAILGFAGWLYQIRRDETAGDLISFEVVKLLCRVFGALTATFGMMIVMLWFFGTGVFTFPSLTALLLLFGAISYLAAEMLIRKTLRVFHKKVLLPMGCFLLVLLLCITGAKLDLLGYAQRVPEPENVTEASIHFSYGMVTVDPEDAIRVHETILDNLDHTANTSGLSGEDYLSVKYVLKDGSVLRRSYYYWDCPEIDQAGEEILKEPRYVYRSWFGNEENSRDTILEGSYQLYDDREGQEFRLTREEALKVYDALCQDIQEGNLLAQPLFYREDPQSQGCLYFIFRAPQEGTERSYPSPARPSAEACPEVNIEISPQMRHTRAALGLTK